MQDYWNERSSQQKMILAGAFLASFLMIIGFGWMASRTQMAMIYGGLDAAQAGEVIAGIERSGVKYEVRGDSIWVAADQRDRLRMEMAAQGLPAQGSSGYELLDGMSGFGTTAQMFDAAYWRAKEGELARTILALPNVQTARVHLAVETGRGYRRDSGGSASVTLTTSGAALTREQAAALRYLISSGVPGLQPDAVTVIDSARGIVSASEDSTGADRAAEMKRNVERILEPHVGIGNAIVELNLELVTETELLTEQRFDPEQRALISQVTEETQDESNSTGSGAVTAASNLPDTAAQAGDSTQSARSENRQQTNYEVSRLTREIQRQPGSTRRLTVAVLVNGVPQTGADGQTVLVPRPDSELEVLRELVASAVGLDQGRGDLLTVKSLPFADMGGAGTLAAPGLMDRLDLNALTRIALIGLFALLVLFAILRPVLRGRDPAAAPELDDSTPPALTPAMTPGVIETADTPPPADVRDISPDQPRPETLSLPSADPVARLRNLMRERHDESVKILSGWIDNKEKAQ
ncbi:flagellar basal-body MS-ring/collar protein FliF [Paracoccus sp. (in: a-proteobacteria)]|uniref:flagellar basal-body MS-ring/collar protein FliF n=1 Tax=Paracoccus sp. TaxID=267 RepID=UPI0026DFEA0D|nr:flagellar basal-body MS-ring/collar protein FliF [Paracoccus sp. (in: a-proteobacteria)]MDO5648390.1 flagellar basal-body MS-ring/collar protein FliF [Paracoccus sp. (in: a-proteobacteria)]